jgi:hypothetical protein
MCTLYPPWHSSSKDRQEWRSRDVVLRRTKQRTLVPRRKFIVIRTCILIAYRVVWAVQFPWLPAGGNRARWRQSGFQVIVVEERSVASAFALPTLIAAAVLTTSGLGIIPFFLPRLWILWSWSGLDGWICHCDSWSRVHVYIAVRGELRKRDGPWLSRTGGRESCATDDCGEKQLCGEAVCGWSA